MEEVLEASGRGGDGGGRCYKGVVRASPQGAE